MLVSDWVVHGDFHLLMLSLARTRGRRDDDLEKFFGLQETLGLGMHTDCGKAGMAGPGLSVAYSSECAGK